jgi:Fe-Mn family superoxide dismutase
MRNIEWSAVQTRYDNATKVEPPPRLHQPRFAEVPGRQRRGRCRPCSRPDHRSKSSTRGRGHSTPKAHDILAGAVWRDPDRVEDWMASCPRARRSSPSAVYGFHVGCETAITLRKAGFDARYMAGGTLWVEGDQGRT